MLTNKTATNTLNSSTTEKNQNSSNCNNNNNKERSGGRTAAYAWFLEFERPELAFGELRRFAKGVLMYHCDTEDCQKPSVWINKPGMHIKGQWATKRGYHYGTSIKGKGAK